MEKVNTKKEWEHENEYIILQHTNNHIAWEWQQLEIRLFVIGESRTKFSPSDFFQQK